MVHASTEVTRSVIAVAMLVGACEPQVMVGTWTCPGPKSGVAAAPQTTLENQPIDPFWRTSFETDFCDYTRAGGYCFNDPDASYDVTDAPVHGGRHAAVFAVSSDPSKDGAQARCFLQGILPKDAYYGAWFYLPTSTSSAGNWNLMHIPGGMPDSWHGLWDVSLDMTPDGNLSLYLFDALRGAVRTPASAPPIPIGSWFHIEVRLLRAKDATGMVALFQDGALLVELTDLITDDADFGQWYVGNLVESISPPESVLYVDDVTIRPAP